MNRYKFRGRHEATKIWATGGVEVIESWNPRVSSDEDRAYIVNRGFRTAVESQTIGQTTCFCDCDNEEIFDGDIVERTLFDNELQIEYVERFLVEYIKNDGKFIAKFIDNGFQQEIGSWLERTKVIGNIHDTPQLLKQKTFNDISSAVKAVQ